MLPCSSSFTMSLSLKHSSSDSGNTPTVAAAAPSWLRRLTLSMSEVGSLCLSLRCWITWRTVCLNLVSL